MKIISLMCSFPAGRSKFDFKIEKPLPSNHPIKFQDKWLSENKNGSVDPELMKVIQDIYDMAQANGLDFEDLCYYAVNSGSGANDSVDDYSNDTNDDEAVASLENIDDSSLNDDTESQEEVIEEEL